MAKALLLEPFDLQMLASFEESIEPVNISATEKNLESIEKQLKQLGLVNITYVLGAEKSSVLYWTAAQRLFPNAAHLYLEMGSQWRDLITGDIRFVDVEEADLVPEPVADQTPLKPRAYAHLKGCELCHEIFRHSYFTLTKDLQHIFNELLDEAYSRVQTDASFAKKINKARQDGAQTKLLLEQLDQKVTELKVSRKPIDRVTLSNWIFTQPGYDIPRIKNAIDAKINKTIHYFANKQKLRLINQQNHIKRPQQQRVCLPPHIFNNGAHPNNLRHLKPAKNWLIYVDETGKQFDHQAQSLDYSQVELGRVVAVLVPDYAQGQLPALQKHHATEQPDVENDRVIQNLLNSSVGVFGFTVKDAGHDIKQGWFDAIYQLVRWVVLLLPIEPKDQTQVRFLVEQYASYNQQSFPIKAIAQRVESELQAIEQQRFENLQLTMEFISKDDAYNGYVDTVAHMWGSPAAASRHRLQLSKMEHHCLLRPDIASVDRLFLLLNPTGSFNATDWYEIMLNLSEEPDNSLLKTVMNGHGSKVKNQPATWQSYLMTVTNKIKLKNYNLRQLGFILNWLHNSKPPAASWSAAIQAQWLSTQLALQNHQGAMDLSLIAQAIALMNQMRDEDAPGMCDLALKIASAATNSFQFSLAEELVDKWLKEKPATVGLMQYAKLESTMGQLAAFKGQQQIANTRFEQAIALFSRLSDKERAERETIQTRTYAILNKMTWLNTQWQNELLAHINLSKPNATNTIKSFATGFDVDNPTIYYSHYLMLRAFVYQPSVFAQEIQSYLSYQSDWTYNDQAHPWEWIYAYRGYLLSLNGQPKLAKQQFEEAINLTSQPQQGAILRYIGLVIAAMAASLGYPVSAAQLDKEQIKQQLQHAPWEKFDDWPQKPSGAQLLNKLNQLLPFNFH